MPRSTQKLAHTAEPDSLLAPSGTCFIDVKGDFDGPLIEFGEAIQGKIVLAVRNLVLKASLSDIH